MSGFFLTFVVALLASFGARDQMLVAQLSRSFAKAPPLLALAWLSSAVTCALAGAGGAWIAPMMPPGGKAMLVAFALGLASLEMIWRRTPIKPPAEPTRSFVAIFVVLLAHQLGDATRFLVFALAVASAEPALVIAGGLMGGGAALTMLWWTGADPALLPGLRLLSLAIAGSFALAAGVIAIRTLGLV